MNPHFVAQIERVLQPLGTLHFWTDVADYYHATLEIIASSTNLEGPFPVLERGAEHDLDYQTHFERRMRIHDQVVWRSEFRKPIRLQDTPTL